MSRERWQQRVQDILDAIAEIDVFVAGMDQEQFTADLTVIGEAARHIPNAVAQQRPDIPWDLMCGMRNRIVHGYYQVDPVIVWDTCQLDLPPLVARLQEMLRENP